MLLLENVVHATSKSWAWLCAATALLLFASTAYTQRLAGEIHVEVKDPSGAPMEASLRLQGLAGGTVQTFQTNAQGMHTFANLAFGRYLLEVNKTGFAAQTELIDVQSDAPISTTVTMTLGTAAYKVDVVSTTPLAGVELLRSEIPSPVQTANQRDIEESGALDLSDFLNRRLDGVHVNEIQGNPFQADVNYRGYTASPLLGTPQGLSVYMDGVRLNQPFGDVVSWDLIPRIAISETALMPGSNPVFGLNTLGGALSIQTKDGARHPGGLLQLSGGSFGRGTIDFEHGGATAKGFNWYMAGSLFFEDGWRESSPSNVRQFMGKVGRQLGTTTLGLTVSYANNWLTGNGLQEQRLLAREYSSIYTKPDITANRAPSFNFTARHGVSSTTALSGNVYYRYIRTNTLNGDINEDSLDQSVYQLSADDRAALAAAGYSGVPVGAATAANTPFPFWRCIAQVLQKDEPAEKCNGLLNRTHSKQHNYGASGQMTWFGAPGIHHNQLTVGGAYDGSGVDFVQSTQLGYLNPDRSVTGLNAFGDGVTGGDVDGAPFDSRVDLHGRIQTGSAFATDTLSIGNAWGLTVSGRYNRTTISNSDRITSEGPGSLNGRHVFDRLNPSFGITFRPSAAFNTYFGYSEGSRAPTSIELGCANPDQPCKLPNALAGDPPLAEVVARTWEAGVRGVQERNLDWNIGWFRGENRNDILFVSSEQTGFGYFKNFGRTRRQGLEVNLNSRIWRVTLGGGYTFLDATYQSREQVDGSSNSSNDAAEDGVPGVEGAITIEPGSRIPLVPRHMLKAFGVIQATQKLSFDIGMVAVSESYARGNENNVHRPMDQYYLGPGTSPGYGVVNLGARYQVHPRLQVFGEIKNLFDHHYYTGAQLGPTGFTDQGAFLARPLPAVNGNFPVVHTTFYAPGSPFGAWFGLRLTF